MVKRELSDKNKNIISIFAIVSVAILFFVYLFFSTNLFNFDAEGMARIQKAEKGLDVQIPNIVIEGEDYVGVKENKKDIVIPSISDINPAEFKYYDFIAHPLYPDFAEAHQTSINNGALSISDTIIYNTGYYSINGDAWQVYTLQGNAYSSGSPWLLDSGTSNLNLPSQGTHYVLVYSCSLVNNAWDCHENKWQLNIVSGSNNNNNNNNNYDYSNEINVAHYKDVSECTSCGNGGSCSCTSDEYCSAEGVCLLSVPGTTYFVSKSGSDSNSGTSLNNAFYSWQEGVDNLGAGDIVYIRGGVWDSSPSSYDTLAFGVSGKSGTENKPIRVFNYPGEKPVFDGINIPLSGYPSGIWMGYVEYWHLRGLTIRNIFQRGSSLEIGGIVCNPCANMIYENLVVHDVEGRGYEHWSGAHLPNGPSTPYSDNVFTDSDTTYYINCDAYNLFTPDEDSPGNRADGWKVETIWGGNYYWIGSRAWNYADDGFNPHGVGNQHFKDCWAMSTDKYEGLSSSWNIEGNGFKVEASMVEYVPDYAQGNHYVSFENCIAVDNVGTGFYNDLADWSGSKPNRAIFYNNLAYNNGYGMTANGGNIVKNNIVYQNGQDISSSGSVIDHNSWNSGVSVSDADFVSLDFSQLTAPRKPDGSLPDIAFGHLRQGSDLIDAGTVISGYHCSTSGSHPGEDCVEWYGSAPDLGPFESNY